MKYLVLTADYNASGIKDEFGDWLNRNTLKLSDSLWQEISNWVLKYQKIINMENQERIINISQINLLDLEGVSIAASILNQIQDCKIKYYSEGLLKYISI